MSWGSMLSPGETLTCEFSIGSRYRYAHAAFWGIVFGLFLIAVKAWGGLPALLAGLWLYYGVYLKAAHRYGFTNKRVLIRKGLLSTKMLGFDFSQVTGVVVRENFLEKLLLKTGTLAIDTAGTAGVEVVLRHVEKPYELQKTLNSLRAK